MRLRLSRDVLESPRRKQPIDAAPDRENHHFWNGSSMARVSEAHREEVIVVGSTRGQALKEV